MSSRSTRSTQHIPTIVLPKSPTKTTPKSHSSTSKPKTASPRGNLYSSHSSRSPSRKSSRRALIISTPDVLQKNIWGKKIRYEDFAKIVKYKFGRLIEGHEEEIATDLWNNMEDGEIYNFEVSFITEEHRQKRLLNAFVEMGLIDNLGW